MRHIGQDAIPRLVSLKQYVAPSSKELQDWMVEMEVSMVIHRDRHSYRCMGLR